MPKANLKKDKLKIEDIEITTIKMEKAMQPRAVITTEAVEEYKEAMHNGDKLPPCVVVREGKIHWLCDGFHRVAAAKLLKLKVIKCEVVVGVRMDAIWIAAAANLKHGVRRTNADKRRAVAMALTVKPDASLRDIGTHCAVSIEMVRQHKVAVASIAELETTACAAAQEAIDSQIVEEQDAMALKMTAAEAAIDKASDAIATAERILSALCSTKHAVYVNQQSVANDLKNARIGLKQANPHQQCPLCDGAGCETCRGCGWVSKRQWDLIPKTQRKASQ